MILNRRTDRPRPRQVYIGRPSKWGNRFRLRHEGERIRVIALYRADLVHRLRTGRVTRAELAELDGRPLVCWCAPLACHGHVLRAAAAWPRPSPTSAWRPLRGPASPSSASSGAWHDPEHERHDSTRSHHQAPVPRGGAGPDRRHPPVRARRPLPDEARRSRRPRRPPRPPARPLDQHARLPERHTDPARGGDPEWQGPVKERARHAAGCFAAPADPAAARAAAAGAPETALRAAVEHAERALSDDGGCYSVSRTHDAALELTEAARALLNELETRHTK